MIRSIRLETYDRRIWGREGKNVLNVSIVSVDRKICVRRPMRMLPELGLERVGIRDVEVAYGANIHGSDFGSTADRFTCLPCRPPPATGARPKHTARLAQDSTWRWGA